MTFRLRDVCPVSKTNSSALYCEKYGKNQLEIKIFAQIQRAKIAKRLINIDQVSVALAIVLVCIENAHSTSES